MSASSYKPDGVHPCGCADAAEHREVSKRAKADALGRCKIAEAEREAAADAAAPLLTDDELERLANVAGVLAEALTVAGQLAYHAVRMGQGHDPEGRVWKELCNKAATLLARTGRGDREAAARILRELDNRQGARNLAKHAKGEPMEAPTMETCPKCSGPRAIPGPHTCPPHTCPDKGDGEGVPATLEVTCGTCAARWCERCDPSPASACHYCTGRGYSTAELAPPPLEPDKHLAAEQREALQLAARDALTVQAACNISGVVLAWARHMPALRKDARATETDYNRHPVCILFASKVASLAGSECATAFGEAFDACSTLAEGGPS